MSQFPKVKEAIERYRKGEMLILVDDEDRENEGDLIVAAEKTTPEVINFMSRFGRGLICLAMTQERCKALDLPLMVPQEENGTAYGTAFTVSIDAKEGITSGISAYDRSKAIELCIASSTRPDDLVRPGHVFPLIAKDKGVLERAGHTEGSVDLARLAGLYPAGVICEIMNEDGTMSRIPELEIFAKQHNLFIISIAELIQYRTTMESGEKSISSLSMQSSATY